MRALLPLGLSLLAAVVVADASVQRSQLSELLNEEDATGFETATTPREFSFPDDHGPHESFRNEWWYVTGNLDADDGSRFGFELTIFRFSLTPATPENDSEWRSNQLFIAHLAVTDADRKRFYVAERFSRGSLGLAGAIATPFRVWIDDWEMAGEANGRSWRIAAADDDIAIDLGLTPLKAPVLNGDAGLSRKSSKIGSASYYYSVTRLRTEGVVTVKGEDFAVTGLSWLDREWSTSALAPDQVGWDWFALQLADGTDLMLYNIRRNDGRADANSSGMITFADGTSRSLKKDEFDIAVEAEWRSPAGGTYPSRWTVRVPAHDIELDVVPVIADQELFTTVRYWEGAVDVTGRHSGQRATGRGYVELTGYAD